MTDTADLSKLPDFPALRQLARALWHNGSIRGAALMVGAGFSKNAILQAPDTLEPPNWSELLRELIAVKSFVSTAMRKRLSL